MRNKQIRVVKRATEILDPGDQIREDDRAEQVQKAGVASLPSIEDRRIGGKLLGPVPRPDRHEPQTLVLDQRPIRARRRQPHIVSPCGHRLSLDPRKRRTTGMKKGMKESYIEDLANRDGPDHALVSREGAAKRWFFGVRAGR